MASKPLDEYELGLSIEILNIIIAQGVKVSEVKLRFKIMELLTFHALWYQVVSAAMELKHSLFKPQTLS